MQTSVLLYGAYGYTGRLIARAMVEAGLRPCLAGRDAQRLGALAEQLDLPRRVVDLRDPDEMRWAASDVAVVLNAAGPFVDTAHGIIQACLRAGAHYLDISGELAVLETIPSYSRQARDTGVMVMPGVGFDVVPSDGLAAHLARALPTADALYLGIRGLALSTRGSVRTLIRHADLTHTIRRNGVLAPMAPGALARDFDFGDGPERCLNVGWGDVATAYYTTGIPTIEVYFDAHPLRDTLLTTARHAGWYLRTPPWQAWLDGWAELLPLGPSEEQRAARTMSLVGVAVDRTGTTVTARMTTPEAYSFTAAAATEIVSRVLRGDFEPGFQTPARVYGPDLPLSLPGVAREDLATTRSTTSFSAAGAGI